MFNFSFIKFIGAPQKPISEDLIRLFVEDKETKRFNMQYFQTSPINIVNREGEIAWLNVPFVEPINSILSPLLGGNPSIHSRKSGKGAAHCFKTQKELDYFTNEIEPYKELVFLRDCLDLSIALSMYDIPNDGGRTELGEAECQVKYYNQRGEYLQKLVDKTQYWLEKLPYFKLADYVCCVPTEHPVMSQVLAQLHGFDFEDISKNIYWENKKDEIKNKDVNEKLALLNQFDLHIDRDVRGKTVLLLDDMYQSGLTLQFIAMKMKQAGAGRVFGMTLVKSLSN